ncbi:MAG: heat-inducible transcriptional repressor HrcA [Oscillospiraceae bacterium]|jgi:heat-inducible transcriptional repressor|nr:heat-inducible transcriptional repressor HrcA [Oscillospiraceae bacterium]
MLTERQKVILGAVVERYIRTGEPVGSAVILPALGMHVSSATVRSEMAELSAQGYLEQPHTSAGRVPSTLGYRYYVDCLMHEREADGAFRRFFAQLSHSSHDPARLLENAVTVLADITRCAAVSALPPGEDARLSRVELVPLGDSTALLVLLTDGGVVKNRLLHLDFPPTPDLLKTFGSLSAKALCGKPMADFSPAYLQGLSASLDANGLELLPVLADFAELAREASQTRVAVEGQVHLLKHKELSGNLTEILALLREGNKLRELSSSEPGSVAVRIGEESGTSALDNTGLILAKYHVGGQEGTLGIVGSTRIDYARLIPGVRYLSQLLGELLGNS